MRNLCANIHAACQGRMKESTTMKDILEALFMGHLDPSDVPVVKTDAYREMEERADRYERELSAQLTEQQQELYIRLSNLLSELNLMDHLRYFKQGFALAVQLHDAAVRESVDSSTMQHMATRG